MYSAASPLLGAGTASAAQIQGWLAAHGTPPPGAGASFVNRAAAWGLNADLVAAQSAHETGYWTSYWSQAPRNNAAGIGVTGAPGVGLSFATPDASIQAQCAHLLSYAVGDGAWTPFDPRRAFMAAANVGACPTLGSLDGKYAVPGDGYGAAIANAANSLLSYVAAHPDHGGPPVARMLPSQADFRHPLHLRPAADVGPERDLSSISWWIVHYTASNSAAGDENVLTSASPPVESAHCNLEKDGTVCWMVPLDVTAWTPGNDTVAVASINVEQTSVGDVFTQQQYESMADAFVFAARQGVPIPATFVGKRDEPGICGHEDVGDGHGGWGGVDHHTDPGPNYDYARLVAEIARVLGTPAPAHERHVNGHTIRGGFLAYLEKLEQALGADEALLLIGLPLSDEIAEHGVTVQYFERARFEWHPGSRPQDFDVLLGRLGAEALASRGQ